MIDPMEGILPLLNRTEMQTALEKAINAAKVSCRLEGREWFIQ